MNAIKGTPTLGLVGATLGFFSGFAAVSLFGPTASRFNQIMHLDPVLVGLLIAIPSLSGSLLRIPFGAWANSSGGRKPFLILLWLSVAGMAGLLGTVYFLYPQNLNGSVYPLLLFLGFLSGCGIATFSVGIGQVSYWFPQSRQGAALGAYAGLGNLAPGLFSLLLPVVLGGWGLAGAYLAWLLFLLAGTLTYQFIGRNAWYFQLQQQGFSKDAAHVHAAEMGQQIYPRGNARQSLVNAAKIGQTWLLVAIYFTTFGGFIAITAWLPTYWKEYFQVSAVTAGSLTALYSLTASIMRVLGGNLSDRIGGERTAILSLLITLAGAAIMSFSNIFWLSLLGIVWMAIGMGVANAAVFKLMPQYVPQAVGGAAGWIGGLGAFGGFVIPPVLGVFVRTLGAQGYASGFMTFVLLAVLALGMAFSLRRAHRLKTETKEALVV